MICRRCNFSNPDSSVYCHRCGSVLYRRPAKRKRRILWYLLPACALVLLVCGYFVYKVLLRGPLPELTRGTEAPSEPVTPKVTPGGSVASLVGGEIVVRGAMREEISRLTAPVVSGAWVALPTWALFGGQSVAFRTSDSNEFPIESGFWTRGDPVVLWRIDAEKGGNTIELFPWKQQSPLEWLSLSPDSAPREVEIIAPRRRGSFISVSLPGGIKDVGVFMQGNRVVGWTYDEWAERGYLWAGPVGADLVPKIRISQFYAFISLNCREAYLLHALAMEEGVSAAERLRAIAQGFRLPSLLESEDLPSQLRPQSIEMKMHSLALELIQRGSAKEVIRIMDEQVLMGAGAPMLIMDTVRAVAKDQDYNRAIQYLEKVKKSISEKKGQSLSGLDEFTAQLYKDWLREIIAKGGYFSGIAAFEEARRAFPDDVEIHLLGVEAALAEGNWTKANELLQMRSFPPAFKDRADQLERRIKEHEDQQAVSVSFNPGESQISVDAILNTTHLQRFVVDTGANETTIPSSIVDDLGIKVDDATRTKLVLTASGIEVAYEVTLESIEIEGLRVDNMKVLIFDLPGFSDCGLLGLDFLNHFRFEIDKQKGLMRLKKREISGEKDSPSSLISSAL
jgi:clan AA aspartic protease (TIGR02281 family)